MLPLVVEGQQHPALTRDHCMLGHPLRVGLLQTYFALDATLDSMQRDLPPAEQIPVHMLQLIDQGQCAYAREYLAGMGLISCGGDSKRQNAIHRLSDSGVHDARTRRIEPCRVAVWTCTCPNRACMAATQSTARNPTARCQPLQQQRTSCRHG